MTDTNTSTDPITDPDPVDPAPEPKTVSQEKYDALMANSRKNEQRAKDNAQAAAELAKLKRQSMTDVEAARAEAIEHAEAAARAKYGKRLVAAELKAAAANRPVDVDALLEGVDAAKFLDAEGEPDVAAMSKWLDRVAPVVMQKDEGEKPDPTKIPMPDLHGGHRGGAAAATLASEFGTFLKGQLPS